MIRRLAMIRRVAAVVLLALAAIAPGQAAGPGTASEASAVSATTAPEATVTREGAVDPAREYFTDTVLVDQHGESLRFYSDLLEGRVVVINAFFTSCTGVCPVMAGNLVRVQDWLDDRLESEVRLISISVDPATDTPEKLAAYAERFGAREGWSFLTGDAAQVDFVLRRLGQAVNQPEDHTSIMAVGNLRTGLWKKVQGLASSADVIAAVDSVLRDEGAEHAGP